MVGNAGSIFISYRRDTTRHVAGRIADRLVASFPGRRVFLDVDSIPGGATFRKVIADAVGQSEAVVVVIAQDWAVRLRDPDDVVLLEVTLAVKAGIEMIPVVVDGAELPRHDALPPLVRPLLDRNALRVYSDQFGPGMDRVVDALRIAFGQAVVANEVPQADGAAAGLIDVAEILRPRSIAELRELSVTWPVLVVTHRAEPGAGERNAIKAFRTTWFDGLRTLCAPHGVRIAWANVGMWVFTDIARFFAAQGARHPGVHLFVGGQLRDSQRVSSYLPTSKWPDIHAAAGQVLQRNGFR